MDNLMLASNIEDTDIIIIDFGCMVKLDETCDVYTSGGLEGTEGHTPGGHIGSHFANVICHVSRRDVRSRVGG